MIRKLSSVFMGRRKPLFVPYEIHLHNNMILVLNPAHMALSLCLNSTPTNTICFVSISVSGFILVSFTRVT